MFQNNKIKKGTWDVNAMWDSNIHYFHGRLHNENQELSLWFHHQHTKSKTPKPHMYKGHGLCRLHK